MAFAATNDTPRARLLWRIVVYFLVLGVAAWVGGDRDDPVYGPQLASATSMILRALGVSSEHVGNVVGRPEFSMRIDAACDAADVTLVVGVAILLSPAPWSARLIGMAITVTLTQLVNLARLVCMFIVGIYLPQYFDLVHHLVWQSAFVVFAVALYIVWLNHVHGKTGEP